MRSQTTTTMVPRRLLDIHLMVPLPRVVPLVLLGVMEISFLIPPSVLQIEGAMVVRQVWGLLLGQNTWSVCEVCPTLLRNKTSLSFSSLWCVAE